MDLRTTRAVLPFRLGQSNRLVKVLPDPTGKLWVLARLVAAQLRCMRHCPRQRNNE